MSPVRIERFVHQKLVLVVAGFILGALATSWSDDVAGLRHEAYQVMPRVAMWLDACQQARR